MVTKPKEEWVDPFLDLPEYPEPDFMLVVDTPETMQQARQIMRAVNPVMVGFDIETYNERTDIWQNVASLFPYIGGKVRTAQIGFYTQERAKYAFVIDLKAIPDSGHHFLKTLLECPREKRTIVGHNLAFEFLYMESMGIRTTADVFDTNVAARVLSANLLPLSPRRYSKGYGLDLGSCAGRDLGLQLDKEEQTSDWGQELTRSQLAYAAKDALVVLDLAELYTKRLQATEQTRAFQADCRVLPMMAACNANGITLDVEKVRQTKIELEAERDRLHQECCDVLGVENPNSPAQLLPVFQAMNPDVTDTTKQTVELLARTHPEVKVLLELKKVVKTIGTYLDPWLKMAALTGGTVHPNLRVIGADTGRMSCPTAFTGSVPNGEFTKTGKPKTSKVTLGATLHGAPGSTREFFKARPGYVMLDADFSAIEVRLAAHMYQDPATKDLALDPAIDAHTLMASKIFGVPQSEVTPDQRKIGKVSRFALQYACGVNKLHSTLESALGQPVERAVAIKAYETWHETHYMISRRMEAFKDKRHPITKLRSPLGRLMCTPDPRGLKMKNRWGQVHPRPGALIHTNGVNWPIQSAGRDLLAEAAILVWNRLIATNPQIKPLHLVHDEILIEVPEHLVDHAVAVVKSCMSDPDLQKFYLGDIPLECETLTGHRWSECH